MSSDILLATKKLPSGTIDAAIGEAHLIKNNFLNIFQVGSDLQNLNVRQSDMTYSYPAGYRPLVDYLENKHQAPVIITNGAKQALSSVFYCLKKNNKTSISSYSPFWCLLKPLAEIHNLSWEEYNNSFDVQSFLCVHPNNPDGHLFPDIKSFANQFKDKNIPFIFDGVYYSHVYLPKTISLESFGDVQIFSFSKYLGLSGIRAGYIVCHNPDFYKHILDYIEATTVGVSIYPQVFLNKILNHRMRSYPTLVDKFENDCYSDLQNNKKICKQINPEILSIPDNLEDIPGMFLWCKCNDFSAFEKAKVQVIEGTPFGKPGFIRMNLAFPKDQMLEIINRLNNL